MLKDINMDHAQKLVRSVNKALASTLNAHIIDAIWGREAAQGRVNLEPIASYDQTPRNGAKPDSVRDELISNLWSYVYLNARPVWIENIRRLDLSKPTINLATPGGQDFIEPRFLHFQHETDSFMAIPFLIRGAARGIYCVELSVSGRLNLEVLRLLERLSDPLTTILWKADIRRIQDEQIDNVITEFTESTSNYTFQDNLKSHKIGFIARPFAPEFDAVEAYIRRVLKDFDASAQHYTYNPGSGYVMGDLMRQMRSSQFGIADITHFNPNVLLELGMMMQIFDKKLLILRRKDDQSELPFDLRPFPYYHYELVEGPEVRIWEPGNYQFESLEPKLKEFMSKIL
jgi:hypothetical protein